MPPVLVHFVVVRKGHSQKKTTDAYVVGWFLGGQKRTRAGQIVLNSPRRETPKNVIKTNREEIGFGFFVDFFVKAFRHDFFVKRFVVVFFNSHC
jgi:hypothetical protein